jgi:hypothetical protein
MEVDGQLHSLTALTPGKEPPPPYPLVRRLDGPQSRSGHCGVDINLLPLKGIKPRQFDPQPVAIPTELSREYTVLMIILGCEGWGVRAGCRKLHKYS